MFCCKVRCPNSNVTCAQLRKQKSWGAALEPVSTAFQSHHLGLAHQEIGKADHTPLGCSVGKRKDAHSLDEVQIKHTEEDAEGNKRVASARGSPGRYGKESPPSPSCRKVRPLTLLDLSGGQKCLGPGPHTAAAIGGCQFS